MAIAKKKTYSLKLTEKSRKIGIFMGILLILAILLSFSKVATAAANGLNKLGIKVNAIDIQDGATIAATLLTGIMILSIGARLAPVPILAGIVVGIGLIFIGVAMFKTWSMYKRKNPNTSISNS